jgi:ribosomal protein S18 acetylase RimI-like enzyme
MISAPTMPPDYAIRLALASDASNIAALGMQVWLHTYAKEGIRQEISDFVFASFSPTSIAELIADSTKFVLVVQHHEHLLAYAVVKRGSPCPTRPELSIELETLYVQAHFAGLGLGPALLLACKEHLEALGGVAQFWLSTWHRNTAAINFYLKLNFQRQGSSYFQLSEEQHENFIFTSPPP